MDSLGHSGLTRLRKPLALIAVVVILAVVVGAYSFRYTLWNNTSSGLKRLSAYGIVLSSDLQGLAKEEVAAKLGSPDRKSDHYALLLLRDRNWASGLNADLLLRLNVSNRITELCYAWKDFVPATSNQYDPHIWKASSPDTKISMSADLIKKWREGDLRNQISTLDQAEKILGEALFVDQWRYMVSEWTALIVDFDPNGKVANVEIGTDD